MRGVVKISSDVFHFPKEPDNGLNNFYVPHRNVSQPPGGPSLTRQEYKEECDINEIMARFETTGVLPAGGESFYYDFTTLPETMMDSMLLMGQATEAFMSLPASVRREFDNDAAQFVDFASDPENLPQMRTWGLAPELPKEPVKPPPMEVMVVNPPDPSAKP